jgi:hypothetical protein
MREISLFLHVGLFMVFSLQLKKPNCFSAISVVTT